MRRQLLGCAAVLCCSWLTEGAEAQCRSSPTVVDTGKQQCGLAPRFDVALELHAGAGLGKPCHEDDAARSCSAPGMPVIGGQVLAEFRLWRRVAIGPVFAYDHRIGSDTFGSGDQRAEYSSVLLRGMFELRWYARGVAAGGAFVAMRAGAAWMIESVDPVEDVEAPGATQIAPVVGLGFGGAFVPYEGLGTTLALHGFIAPFPQIGPPLEGAFGYAYGYGTLFFVGLTVGLMYGANL